MVISQTRKNMKKIVSLFILPIAAMSLSSCFRLLGRCDYFDGEPANSKNAPKYNENRFLVTTYKYDSLYGGKYGKEDNIQNQKSSFSPTIKNMGICPSDRTKYLTYFCDAIFGNKSFDLNDPNSCIVTLSFASIIPQRPIDLDNYNDLSRLETVSIQVVDEFAGLLYEWENPLDGANKYEYSIDGRKEWIVESDFKNKREINLFNLLGKEGLSVNRNITITFHYESKENAFQRGYNVWETLICDSIYSFSISEDGNNNPTLSKVIIQ